MDKIRIMIVDDMEEIRNYLCYTLKNEHNIEVVASASSGKEAYDIAVKKKPDVILMDIQMESDTSGIAAGKKILNVLPSTKLIALTMYVDSEKITDAYMVGFVHRKKLFNRRNHNRNSKRYLAQRTFKRC